MTTQRPENTENKNYRESVIQNIGIIQCEAPDKNLYKKTFVKPLTVYRQNSYENQQRPYKLPLIRANDIENIHGETPEKMSR